MRNYNFATVLVAPELSRSGIDWLTTNGLVLSLKAELKVPDDADSFWSVSELFHPSSDGFLVINFYKSEEDVASVDEYYYVVPVSEAGCLINYTYSSGPINVVYLRADQIGAFDDYITEVCGFQCQTDMMGQFRYLWEEEFVCILVSKPLPFATFSSVIHFKDDVRLLTSGLSQN
uniref:Uncharacterized protein n=1 Tax=viral metagenome TaxID=1070528 RepID=A0A2V0RA22_9ZZZZ